MAQRYRNAWLSAQWWSSPGFAACRPSAATVYTRSGQVTSPDLAYTVTGLSQHTANPWQSGDDDQRALNHASRYLQLIQARTSFNQAKKKCKKGQKETYNLSKVVRRIRMNIKKRGKGRERNGPGKQFRRHATRRDAHENEKKKGRTDIPIFFVLELGIKVVVVQPTSTTPDSESGVADSVPHVALRDASQQLLQH